MYCAKLSKSDQERQIPYDFTMRNLKSKIKYKQNRKKTHKYREQTDDCQRIVGLGHWVNKVKGLGSTNW